MSTLAPVFVELIGDGRKLAHTLGSARKDIQKLHKNGASSFSQLAHVGKASLLGIGTAAVAVGGMSLHLADQFELAHARLTAAIRATGANADSFSRQIAQADSRMAKFGFTSTDTEGALALMTAATRSPTRALADLQVAADLARLKNISLAEASGLVAKAQAGQLKGVKALGLDLPLTTGGATKLISAQHQLAAATTSYNRLLDEQHHKKKLTLADHYALVAAQTRVREAQHKVNAAQSAGNDIVSALAKVVKGQAATASETFAGKLAAVKAQTENLLVKIGLRLIPVIERLINATVAVVDWLGKHKTIALVLAGAVGGVLVIAMAAFVASLWASASAALGAETALAPILLVAAAIGVAALLLATHWRQVWAFIKNTAASAWAFLRPILTAVKRIGLDVITGAVATLRRIWQDAWGAISTTLSVAWSIVKPILKAFAVVALLPLAVTILLVRRYWHDAWAAMRAALSVAWAVMRPVVDAIKRVGLTEIRLTVAALKAAWSLAWGAIKATLSVAWSLMRPILSAIKTVGLDVIKNTVNALKTAWSLAWGAIKTTVQDVWRVIKPIFDALIGAASKVIDVVGKVAGVAGKIAHGAGSIVSKAIPGLASGGIVTRPTLAMIGEGSEPEAVVPLSRLAQMRGSGSGDVHVTVVLDGRVVHRSVQKHDKEYQSRNGGRSALAA